MSKKRLSETSVGSLQNIPAPDKTVIPQECIKCGSDHLTEDTAFENGGELVRSVACENCGKPVTGVGMCGDCCEPMWKTQASGSLAVFREEAV